jgi:rare lipoprotein A
MSPRGLPSAAVALTALLTLSACARAVVVTSGIPPEQTGLASWYGSAHEGRPTASGELFDSGDLTAAHRTLPFGTRLLVTDLESGRAVEVRVNDRGPFVDGRILDLSYAAAVLLAATGRGVIPVKLQIIGVAAAPRAIAGSSAASHGYSLQIGAFTARERADRLRRALDEAGSPAMISEVLVGGAPLYRVRIGPFPDRSTADAAARRLAARGYASVLVTDP